MKRTLFYLLLLFSVASCSSPIKPILIDNPTEKPITLKFEGLEEITINPDETISHSVPFGKSTLIINGSGSEEIDLDSEEDYLLNPSKEDYYIQTLRYFNSKKDEANYLNNYGPQVSTVEGFEVNGTFVNIKEKLVIRKTWVFGLDSPATQSGSSVSPSPKGYVNVKKIYRKKDLLNSLLEEFTQELFKSTKQADN